MAFGMIGEWVDITLFILNTVCIVVLILWVVIVSVVMFSAWFEGNDLKESMGKILLEEVEIPSNVTPGIPKELFFFFCRAKKKYFIYGNLKVTEDEVLLKIGKKYVMIAVIHSDRSLMFKGYVSEGTRMTVYKLLYALRKIMEAKISEAGNDLYGDSESKIVNYQGVRVVEEC